MKPGTKFCPDHPEVQVPEYAERCTQCNKPLQVHVAGAKTPDGPGPVVVEELENTIHDPRIHGVDYPPPEVAPLVEKRLAEEDEPEFLKEVPKELHETIMDKIKSDEPPRPNPKDPGTGPRPGTAASLKATIKEKIEAKKAPKGHK